MAGVTPRPLRIPSNWCVIRQIRMELSQAGLVAPLNVGVPVPAVKRIGYLIPEFPGQTHIFFWRERQALHELGIEADLVSTRSPPQRIVSHSWSERAIAETEYLYPVGLEQMVAMLRGVARAFPSRIGRCLNSIRGAEGVEGAARFRLFALALAGARVAELARRRGWLHLHAHSCADSAHVALFAHLLAGLPYSITLHGPLADYGPNQRQKWRHAAFAVVITNQLRQEVQRELSGDLPPVIEVAPMGVDTAKFRRRLAYRPWRGEGPLHLFTCARLNFVKGHRFLIDAVAALRAKGLDARLAIAGEDEAGGTAYRRTLEAAIAELRLGEAVTLLGAVSEERVHEELEGAHVFALASLAEPLGVAIMEAMAMEVPVVATRLGGVPELVNEGRDGLLVAPERSDLLAGAIERVARDPELAEGLAVAGRRKVEESFQSTRSAAVLARHLRSAADSDQQPA